MQTTTLGLAVICSVAAVLYSQYPFRPASDPIALTLSALSTQQTSFRQLRQPCSSGRAVAVGYNACIDMVVSAPLLFQRLLDSNVLTASDFRPVPHSKITSAAELAQTFASFFSNGAASERFCNNPELFARVVDAAKSTAGVASALGGNAAIMSARLAQTGCPVRLGASAGSELLQLCHERVQLADPAMLQSSDDVHLIIEYPKGPLFPHGPHLPALSSPRANRFILTREQDIQLPVDLFNRSLQSMAARGEVGGLVLSGFHMFDGTPSAQRVPLFQRMSSVANSLPSDAVTHLEIASAADSALYAELAQHSIGLVQSLGTNEQELAALYDVLTIGTMAPEGYAHSPEIGSSLSKIGAVMERTGLRRVHLHSIAFQAVCQLPGSFATPEHSLVEAVLTATRQACQESSPSPSDLELLFPSSFSIGAATLSFDPRHPVQCGPLASSPAVCCVAPVLVCKQPKRLVGLGDHISAAALTPYL